MKRTLTAFAATALLALGLSSAAHATSYDCDGGSNPVPNTFINNSVEINHTGACTIGNPIHSAGPITIIASGALTTNALTADANDISVAANSMTVNGSISAGGSVSLTAGGGDIDVNGDVESNTGGLGGNMILSADGNIATNNITTNGGAVSGGVEIRANSGGGNTVFNIGGGGSNGINGTINTSGTTAGGTSQTGINSGIFITNGNGLSTGGITVSSMSAIQLTNSASRSGQIILNAQSGTITLPSGKLDSDGATGYGAGLIVLMADTVATANGTIISASQDSTADATYHGVRIAANTITVTGASGLQIHGDGNGDSGGARAYVDLPPKAHSPT